jgi:hypothetical protein
MLYIAGREIIGKKLLVKDFQKVLSSHIKSSLPVKVVRKQNDHSQKPGMVYMGGTYYSDFDKGDYNRYIEIVLSYHPLDTTIKMTEYRWTRICSLFADTILHEIIHMRQYRRRDWKELPFYQSNAARSDQRKEQEYLGCSDEIDAYSFNIACELVDKFKNSKDIADYISKKHRRGRLKSSSLRMYLKAFDYNTTHPIIRKLKKRVISYIPNAELGKPYRNRDWICH